MILWTFRHTKPYNPNDVCYGRLDFDVSPSFNQESQEAIQAFLKEKPRPQRLYSSPLKRCIRLAESVSKFVNLPIEIESSLIEVNFGTWEGEKLSNVSKSEMKAWKNNLRGFRFPEGENFYDVDSRVQKFLDTLEDNGEFLWITHAGVIASLEHFACNVPDNEFVEGAFSYTMINRFDFIRNENGHFVGTFRKIFDGIQMPPLPLE